jgi:hypothetical protein
MSQIAWRKLQLGGRTPPSLPLPQVFRMPRQCVRETFSALISIAVVGWVVWFHYEKVKLSLCFNWAPRHERVMGEWMYSSSHSLISALDGGEWSASRPGRLTPRERAPGNHWIGRVGPRVVLDTVVKRKIPSPRLELNPKTPIVQPVAQRYTNWGITALGSIMKTYENGMFLS